MSHVLRYVYEVEIINFCPNKELNIERCGKLVFISVHVNTLNRFLSNVFYFM